MGKPIQLLDQDKKGFKIHTKEVFNVLDKIANKNVAVVSINGNKRTGKSFMLNFFLRYLYAQNAGKQNWISDNDENSLSGFEWRGGAERHTVGIWMWSEPFFIKSKSGDDIAVLLLDTQGNFDEKTTFQECGVIFSLSALMSSTLILNMKNEISEDKLQFVEFFTFFAESFSSGTKSDQLFQRLIFLIRDWENSESHPFGYHDDVTPENNNYKRKMIEPNDEQCNEAQNTRRQILSYFEHVSSFLMPHPGKKVSASSFKGQSDLIDDDFVEVVKKFVPLVFSSSNIEPKKIGGELVNGASLKEYLVMWADVIKTQKIPEAKTLTQAAADVNYTLARNHALATYERKMRDCLKSNATEIEFDDAHQQTKKESEQYFQTEPQGNIDEGKKSILLDSLLKQIDQIYEYLKTINSARIEREESQEKLNNAIESQKQLEIQMAEQRNANKCEKTELENELRNIKHASELQLKELEGQLEIQMAYQQNAAEREEELRNEMQNLKQDSELQRKNLEEQLETQKEDKINAAKQEEALRDQLKNLILNSQLQKDDLEERRKLMDDNFKMKEQMMTRDLEHKKELAYIENQRIKEKIEMEERAREEEQARLARIKKEESDGSCCVM